MAVDPNIKKKANDIRTKVYGSEVRESLASGLEEMSSDVVENEGRQSAVEGRQDSVESQWQAVSDEMTDKDVISAPEVIAARNGEANLKARLDKNHNEVTAQLAQTVKKNIVDEIPSDLSIYPEGSIIMANRAYVDNMYWKDDFQTLNTDNWHVWQSEPGIITIDGGLKMASNEPQTAFAYHKKGFRKDISGKLTIGFKKNASNIQGVLEVYDRKMVDVNISIWNNLQFIFMTDKNDKVRLRVYDKSGKEHSWNDELRQWVTDGGALVLTSFSFGTADKVKLEVIVDVEQDGISFIITNETQGLKEKTSSFPLSDLRGANHCYPHMADISTTAIRHLSWTDVSYTRLGE